MNTSAKYISRLGMVKELLGSTSRVYPEKGIKRLKDKVKYFVRGLATPQLTRKWFQILAKRELSGIVAAHPRLLSKLQRPYLHRKLGPRERLEVLEEHFNFAVGNIPVDVLEKIYSAEGLKLADIHIEEVGSFALNLFYRDRFEKEGEMMLSICSDGGKRMIFTLSFTVIAFNGKNKCLFIGGLQGFHLKDGRQTVVDITRGMHGMRPKGLLLFTVQLLAKIWGINKIQAVSNELNIFRDFRLNKKKVVADYDEFWRESDGIIGADGVFTLPHIFVPRPMTEIKPNKRTLYKKRYALLEELTAKIVASLPRG